MRPFCFAIFLLPFTRAFRLFHFCETLHKVHGIDAVQLRVHTVARFVHHNHASAKLLSRKFTLAARELVGENKAK